MLVATGSTESEGAFAALQVALATHVLASESFAVLIAALAELMLNEQSVGQTRETDKR